MKRLLPAVEVLSPSSAPRGSQSPFSMDVKAPFANIWDDYTSANLPKVYLFSAFWAGQSGSLLFWCLILANPVRK